MSIKNSFQKDYYAILGLDPAVETESLRRAYLALAVKWHPDRNPGDRTAEERFKDISQAYAVLSDPAARARYDRMRLKKAPRPAAETASGKRAPRTAKSASAGAGARPSAAGNNGKARQAASRGGTQNGFHGFTSTREAATAYKEVRDRPGHPRAEAGFEDILGFFQSARGQETLKDLERELAKAGLSFKPEDFTGWLRGGDRTPTRPTAKGPSLWKRLGTKLRDTFLRTGTPKDSPAVETGDLSYNLSLNRQAARTGASIEITYQPNGQTRTLAVKIPAGVQDGLRLRLRGQGHTRPDQTRGDLILNIIVQP